MDVAGTVATAVPLDPPRAGVSMLPPSDAVTRTSLSAWSRNQRMRFQRNKKKGKVMVRLLFVFYFLFFFFCLFLLFLSIMSLRGKQEPMKVLTD